MFMRFLIGVTIIGIILHIYFDTSKEKIYRNNPCDSNYVQKLILFTFIYPNPDDKNKQITYNSSRIMFVKYNMTDSDIARYLFKNRYLFNQEYDESKNHYKAVYSKTLEMSQISIQVVRI